MESPLIALRGVGKSYVTRAGVHPALADVDLDVRAGESLAIVGRSGSGKSTLLNLVAGIDRPSRGDVTVAGVAVHREPESRLARWRGRTVGVVFQFFQLLPTLTVAENVVLPMDFCRVHPPRERRARARELLERVGIAEQADKFPTELSGGQQQRAAIARALANEPPIVVADEPTGNLDSATAAGVIALLVELARGGTTVLVATHDRGIAAFVDRTIELADGAVVAR